MTMHEGHRGRLRERFRTQGLDSFADHEALELLLCFARPRANMNPLAHRLIDHFGSLKGVFEAGVDQLLMVEGVGPETATLISMILPLYRQYQTSIRNESRYLCGREAAERYCTALLTGLRTERFYVVCVSSSMRLLGHRLIAEGSLSEVPAYPRLVIQAAMNHNAYGVFLCHNHPGGDARPSEADLATTRTLQNALGQLGIQLIDHFIVSDLGSYSLAQHNDLPPVT